LLLLREKLENAKNSEKLKNVVKKGKKLLADDLKTIAGFCGIDEKGTLPGARGLSFVRQVEDERWRKYKDVRRKMAQLLDDLD
jgi:hypothetical protein